MNQSIDVQMCFQDIMKALRNADKRIKKTMSAFQEVEGTPTLKEVEGIFSLDEKHVQYIVYKALLEMGKFPVYIEDPYAKGMAKYCDVTVYAPDWRESLWIEIKATGWCEDEEYMRWVKSDTHKLGTLRQRGAKKYLLVTSIEDGKQDKTEWKDWFDKKIREVEFAHNLFDFFVSKKFKDGKKIIEGYYVVCLLRVKA